MAIFAKKKDAKGADTKATVETDSPGLEKPDIEAVASDATAAGLTDVAPVDVAPVDVAPVDVAPVDVAPVEIDPAAILTAGESNGFGIADAIRLMRSLPSEPMDLVVRVVRVTLGAVNVSVEDIVEDARRKEKRIEESVAALEAQVVDLEKQLYARRCEISEHEVDLKETAQVRERLYQADKSTGHRPPPTPPDATRVPLSNLAEWGRSDQGKGE